MQLPTVGIANNLAMVAASSAATAVATSSNAAGQEEGAAAAAAGTSSQAEDAMTIASNQKGLPIQMMITPGVSVGGGELGVPAEKPSARTCIS